MPLTPGTRLGLYEVISAIGAGGMDEVYRATDTKLKRHVAIKILPPSVAASWRLVVRTATAWQLQPLDRAVRRVEAETDRRAVFDAEQRRRDDVNARVRRESLAALRRQLNRA